MKMTETVLMPPFPPANILGFMGEDEEKSVKNGDHLIGLMQGKYDTGPVLDIGCGYARMAYALARHGYEGEYYGTDVNAKTIGWLKENFTLPGYHFEHVDMHNSRYNPNGGSKSIYLPEVRPQIVLLLSVFTHMEADDILAHLESIKGLMEEKSTIFATCFFLNEEQQALQDAGRSKYPMQAISDTAAVFDKASPLHAIAFKEEWLLNQIEKLGLYVEEKIYGQWCGRKTKTYQDTLFLRRKN
jgi:SAM-dependent methyltransferase